MRCSFFFSLIQGESKQQSSDALTKESDWLDNIPSWLDSIDLYSTHARDKVTDDAIDGSSEEESDRSWYWAVPREFADIDSLVRSTQECLEILKIATARGASLDLNVVRKSHLKLAENLASMVFVLYGNEDIPVDHALALKLVHTNLLHTELFHNLCMHVLLLRLPSDSKRLELQMKRDMSQIFKFILRDHTCDLSEEYIDNRPEILQLILTGCRNSDSVPSCSDILRQCIRREALCQLLLDSELLNRFLDTTHTNDFNLATQAFLSLTMLLTRHPKMAVNFMMDNYDTFIKGKLNKLCQTRNYVNKRLALVLLYSIVTTRSNFKLMIRYVSDTDNLQLIIDELRSKKLSIQTDAWDIFKIFVYYPKKPAAIEAMLKANQHMLVRFIGKFQELKKADETFNADELQMILRSLQSL